MFHQLVKLLKYVFFLGIAGLIQNPSSCELTKSAPMKVACGSNRYHLHMRSESYSPDPLQPIASTLKIGKCLNTGGLKSMHREYFPPVIYHINTEVLWENLEDMINVETKLSTIYIKELLEFGAIYGHLNTFSTKKTKRQVSTGPIQAERIDMKKLKGLTNIPIGSYFRVHANPRRNFGGYLTQWNEKCLEITSLNDILIVDKPFDLPTIAGVDNTKENLVNCVEEHYKIQSNLHVVSRLDACTSGLVPLARSPVSAAILSKAIADRSVLKVYKVLCRAHTAPKVGQVRHWFRKKGKDHANGKPPLLRNFDWIGGVDDGDWQLADLEILTSSFCDIRTLNLDMLRLNRHGRLVGGNEQSSEKEAGSEYSEQLQSIRDPPTELSSMQFYECLVKLSTGRTHQIRLQFAAIGAPVVGDTRYEPVQGLVDEGPDRETPWGDGKKLFGPEPKIIGLQCHELTFPISVSEQLSGIVSSSHLAPRAEPSNFSLLFNDGDVVVKCLHPWWRHTVLDHPT